jgi:ATP-dependent RNA helicase DDX60
MKLSHEGLVEVEKLTSALGLPKIEHRNSPTPGQCLSICRDLAKSTEGLSLPIDVIDFELENCGPYLDRGFDSQPDSRVPFEPDAWQRKVLDAIDSNKSLFVVAPTSAGKTFISFYAMKKILQANDDDVLVYIAPTKALVNQIAAEIQARFSKTFSHEGRSVWAVHTRDYRINNPNGCQILVTVPHILQIMLLAPSSSDNAKSWAHRVKRIIFDEVHCIGQAEDGVIWEQLLLLAPCPIIALSATVGNPFEFKDWLEGTQKVNGFDLEMIIHSSRYSDLRKYLYKPPTEFTFRGIHRTDRLPIPGIESSGELSRFCSIHPIASIVSRLDLLHPYLIYLCFESNPRCSSQGIPNDISLEPRDCLTLWRCMAKHQTKDYPIDESLSPQNLPEIVKKTDIHEWERDLKAALQGWILDLNSPFSSVQKELQMSVKRFHDNIEGLPESQTHNAAFGGKPKTGGMLASIFPLLLDLHSHGALPVLMFNYDREKCEKVILKILEQLVLNEKDWKKSSSEWAQKLADYERWKRAESIHRLKKDKVKKDKARKAPKRKDQDDDTPTKEPTKLPTKLEMAREEASKEISIWETFNPAAPVEMFSFADKTKFSNTELEETLASLKGENIDENFIDAIRRGLGVHHAGMNRKYRQM